MSQNPEESTSASETDLFAQDLTVDELDTEVAAGFTTAGSFASAGSASCPIATASSGSSFSSAGG